MERAVTTQQVYDADDGVKQIVSPDVAARLAFVERLFAAGRITRKRRYQLRAVARGVCRACYEAPATDGERCAACADENRQRAVAYHQRRRASFVATGGIIGPPCVNTSGVRRCGICDGIGHNKRCCPQRHATVAAHVDETA